jgi:uncharacterized OB-fold protein
MNIAQNWRLNEQRYALKGARCEKCDKVSFPPREVCPHCREEELKAAEAVRIDVRNMVTERAR